MPKQVYLEDKSITVEFDDSLSENEIGNIIQQEFYGKNLEEGVKPSRNKVAEAGKSIWKGIQQPILSSPQAAASMIMEFGEMASEKHTSFDFVQPVAGMPSPVLMKGIKSFIAEKTTLDENMIAASKEMIRVNQDFLQRKEIGPEEGKVNRFLFNLGSGVTTLGAAVGVTALTKSPHAGAALFGAYQKANIYQEAREKGVAPKKASELSTIAGVVEGSLEYIGLDFMFKQYGSKLLGLGIRSGTEALQEWSQATGENLVVKLGGIDTLRPIFEGAAESALIGFILGGAASAGLDLMRNNNVKKSLTDGGITEEQAESIMTKINDEVRKESGNIVANETSEMAQAEVKEEAPAAEEVVEPTPSEGKALSPKDFASAEEFVKARTTGFHGTTAGADVKKLRASSGGELGEGLYFSRDFNVAKKYGTPDTREIPSNKFATIPLDVGNLRFKRMTKQEFLDLRNTYFDKEKAILEKAGKGWSGESFNRAVSQMEADIVKEGFDGIYTTDVRGSEQGVVFKRSISKIKTKFQLIDIWNKAQGKEEEVTFDVAEFEKEAKDIKANIKDLVIKKKLETRLDEIADKKMRAAAAKEMLEEGGKVERFLKGRVKRHAKGYLKEKLAAFPKGFFTTKEGAITLDEAIDEVNKAGLGVEFTSESDLAEFLKAWADEKAMLKDMIEAGKEKIIKKRETSVIKQRLKDIQAGIKKGQAMSKQEIKTAQNEVIALLKESDLTPKDKAKFIDTIKNVTQDNMQKAMPGILERIERLEQAELKRSLEGKIKKELKATKPVKVGQKKVGRYDYESNKLFEEIRAYNKLNKTDALAKLDAYTEEDLTEIDLIKRRFLSLKANGKEASVEIFDRVYKDIRAMKAIGEQAKSEADFIKKVNRQEKVDQALSSMAKVKADKGTVKTKIGNVYRKGFSNIYSMLNSMFGKEFAEQYDPEIHENNRDTAIYFKVKEMTDEAARIYDEKNVIRTFETMSKEDYKLTDFEGLSTKLTKLDLIDIYNSLKNDTVRERYNNAFGEAQVENLMGELTAQDVEFADYLQRSVQEYRKVLNERNIEITGRDLGFVENYWPATSEFQVSVLDDVRVQGETPSALKERAKSNKVIPVPRNAWLKAQKHVAQAEHVANLSREYETLKRMFNDRKVKHAIKEKFGDDVYNVLIDQIENISLNAQTKKIDAVSQWFGHAINNWVTSKIALNPTTYIRQLMSVGNYIENMNSGEWVKGFTEGILSPKETFDFMWKNAPFLEARFNRGYSEAVKEAISGAESLNANWSSYTKFLTSLVRSGDITAIIYGGYPLVQSELAKGKTMKVAIETFEKATLKSQQSGLSSSISQFQNSRNPFARLFLAFKNTSNQYFRKMADAVISYQNGDISAEQFAKTMAIYAVIQPILYAASGFWFKRGLKEIGYALGVRRPREEVMKEFGLALITQMAVSPVNAIPVLDDIMMFAVRKLTGQKVWKVFSTPLFDDLETGLSKLGKKEVTASDYLEAMTSIAEPVTALPIKTFLRYYKNIKGDKKKSVF